MQANRRSFVAGALAACGEVGKPAAAARGAASGMRRFDLHRVGTRIGRQSATLLRSGSQVTVEVDVDIAVRFRAAGGAVDATRWKIGGDLADLDLLYDRRGEWIGPKFQARSERVSIVRLDVDASLAPLRVDGA